MPLASKQVFKQRRLWRYFASKPQHILLLFKHECLSLVARVRFANLNLHKTFLDALYLAVDVMFQLGEINSGAVWTRKVNRVNNKVS